MSTIYAHYGATEFKKELFVPIKNEIYFSKPMGGFWASPVTCDYGYTDWLNYCTENQFRQYEKDNLFRFTLSNEAKVLKLTTIKQLLSLPHTREIKHYNLEQHYLDFEVIMASGVDAIEIEISELYWALYGWDVDSILIMNPDIIVPITEKGE